jgi:hypothetical protein
VYGQYWPIQNVHTHSQPLLSFLRFAGVEPIAEGLRIVPSMQAASWSVESPSFALAYTHDAVAGRMSTRGDRIELHVRLPEELVGRKLRVTSSAATARHELRGADVIIGLAGPARGEWAWRIERA